MIFHLKWFSSRYILSVSMAVVIAVILNHYIVFSQEGWLVLTAFIVNQTAKGASIRQGIMLFMLLLGAILLASFLIMNIKSLIILNIILGIIFMMSGYFILICCSQMRNLFFLILFFSLVLLIATLLPTKSASFTSDRIMDVIMGGVVGILCAQIISPFGFGAEFKQGIVPILSALINYSTVLTNNFLSKEYHDHVVVNEKIAVEQALQIQKNKYPEWVFEPGFNPGLRAGFRFFLIQLDRVIEILFSMHDLASHNIDTSLLQEIAPAISHAMAKNQELLYVLKDYFAEKLKETTSDFTTDIVELENVLRQITPASLELLDLSSHYITLTILVRDIKDLRELLLLLIKALPNKEEK